MSASPMLPAPITAIFLPNAINGPCAAQQSHPGAAPI